MANEQVLDWFRPVASQLFAGVTFERASLAVCIVFAALCAYIAWALAEYALRRAPVKTLASLPPLQIIWRGMRFRAKNKEVVDTDAVGLTQEQRVTGRIKNAIYKMYVFVAPSPWKVRIIGAFALTFIGFYIVHFFASRPYIISVETPQGGPWYDHTQPVTITFDRPIQVGSFALNIAPPLPGTVKWIPTLTRFPELGLFRSLKFYPGQTFLPEQDIVMYAVGMQSITGAGGIHEHNMVIPAIKTPGIAQTSIAEGTRDVAPDTTIDVTFDNPNGGFVEWQYTLNPERPFTTQVISPTLTRITFDEQLEQSTSYAFTMARSLQEKAIPSGTMLSRYEFETVKTLTFATVKAPFIQNFSPSGTGVLPSSPIEIEFDLPMDRASVEKDFSITPETPGTFKWKDDIHFIFTPTDPLAFNTDYTIRLTSDSRSLAGGTFITNLKREFHVIGAVKVTKFSPSNGAQRVERNTAISVAFDQPVNKKSAEKNFQVSPALSGSFAWKENALTFRPTNMQYGKTYKVSIVPGVVSIHGQNSTENFSASFTTAPEIFVLNVPQYFQGSGTFHCNVVATRMALAYKGVFKSTDQVIAGVGIGKPLNGNTGGDPYTEFVDGYGTYWTAIQDYVRNFRNASAKRNWNLTAMLQEVKNGNPSVIWWQNGWSSWYWKTWTTPLGTTVSGLNGMHSEVVVGYQGSVTNAHTIITNDTWRGKRYYNRSYFDNLWRTSFNRSAVVVY